MVTQLRSGDFAGFGEDSAFFEEVRRQRLAHEQNPMQEKPGLTPLFIGGVLLASQQMAQAPQEAEITGGAEAMK